MFQPLLTSGRVKVSCIPSIPNREPFIQTTSRRMTLPEPRIHGLAGTSCHCSECLSAELRLSPGSCELWHHYWLPVQCLALPLLINRLLCCSVVMYQHFDFHQTCWIWNFYSNSLQSKGLWFKAIPTLLTSGCQHPTPKCLRLEPVVLPLGLRSETDINTIKAKQLDSADYWDSEITIRAAN